MNDKQSGDLFTGDIPEYRDDFDAKAYAKSAFLELCRFHYSGQADYLERAAEEIGHRCDKPKDDIVKWINEKMQVRWHDRHTDGSFAGYKGRESYCAKELQGMIK